MVWLQVWTILLHGLFAQAVLPWPGTLVPVTPPLTGMAIWWSADVGNNCSGVACTDGAGQTTWADRSGNGNTGLVSRCGVTPTFHTNQINGKPAVTFNGNSSANVNATCYTATTSVDNKATSTMFAVVKFGGSGGYIIASGTGTPLKWGGYGSIGSNTIQILQQGSVANIGASVATGNQNWNQINATYDSSTGAWALRTNRAADGSGTQIRSITSNFLDLGITESGGSISTLLGQVAEFILYTRVLSSTEITTVETYLNSKYGL